jgi:predicted RNase H-like HicB family nuclease
VPGIAGAHTEAETLDELHEKLTEVLELCLSEIDFSRPIINEIELSVDEYN